MSNLASSEYVGSIASNSLSEADNVTCTSESSNPVYYVINLPFGKSGLFCICVYAIYHSVYALNKGYIPVMDLRHNCNQYFRDGRVYKDNVWEYFFEQPCGVSLDCLEQTSNILVSDDKLTFSENLFDALKDIKKYRVLYKRYLDIIKLNKRTQKFVDDNYKNLVGDESEVLGIICRGSDYVKLKLYGHNIQPNPKDVLKKAKELKNKYNYKKIWLATEDANIYKMFKDEFGDVLIDNNQFMFGDTGDKVIADIEVNRPNHRYRLGMEYLSSIYIISKCKYIIGGTVTAMLGAWILSNGFEKQKYVYIWDLGCYGVRKREECKNIFQKFLSVKDEVYEDTKYKVLIFWGKHLRLPFRTKVKNFNKVPYIAEEE